MLWVGGDDKVDQGENGCSLTTGQKCAPGGKDKCPAGPWWPSAKRIAVRAFSTSVEQSVQERRVDSRAEPQHEAAEK